MFRKTHILPHHRLSHYSLISYIFYHSFYCDKQLEEKLARVLVLRYN